MDSSLVLALIAIALPVLLHLLMRANKPRQPAATKLPSGSLGLLVISQSLGLLCAMHANTAKLWI